jgi:hypothetical protein
MFSVIFEVLPRQDNWGDYLDNAKMLRPELEQIDGFIDNIRAWPSLSCGHGGQQAGIRLPELVDPTEAVIGLEGRQGRDICDPGDFQKNGPSGPSVNRI